MSARHFILALATALAIAMQSSLGAEQPNVLFLLTDDQRSDTIAALGNEIRYFAIEPFL